MQSSNPFSEIPTTTFADVLPDRKQIIDMDIRPLWCGAHRIAGPAFCVQLSPGDNLMLHAAIYQAPKGSVIVVDGCDNQFAVAGGNVCKVAMEREIAGFIIDGVIRDIAEIRQMKFPVFARGTCPIPGKKEVVTPLNTPITCGGVRVMPGDFVVADEEGIFVVPFQKIEQVLKAAQERLAKDESEGFDTWLKKHKAKIDEIFANKKS